MAKDGGKFNGVKSNLGIGLLVGGRSVLGGKRVGASCYILVGRSFMHMVAAIDWRGLKVFKHDGCPAMA